VGGAFTAYQVADLGQRNAPSEQRNVTNETIPQEYDAYQFVDKALLEYTAGFNDSVTVYNNSSVELTEGVDYEWNSTDGTIKFNDTPKTNESNPANITYQYQWNTQRVREVSGPLSVVTDAIGKMGLFAGGVSLIVFLIVTGGFVAKRIGGSNVPARNR
ncbi:MAG: hypothetical protein ABEI52_07190, partial [Halobacteriaceae archaeon]